MDKNIFGEKELFIQDIAEEDKPEDPIIKDAFNRIWEKLQQNIYQWKTFKTDLPFKINSDESASDHLTGSIEQERIRHIEDLHAMCHDENGNRKRLNDSQYQEIIETARFTVKSSIDEKYDNIWMLGSFLQLGRKESRRRLDNRKERASRHWYLYLPEYFSADNAISIRQGFTNLKQSLIHLFRVTFGFHEKRPRYSEQFINKLIQKKRIKFLFSESSPVLDDLLRWITSEGIELNIILANLQKRSKILDLISKLQQQLESSGEIYDSSLLQALIDHPYLLEIDPELPELIEKLHHFYLQLSKNNPRYQQLYTEKYQLRDQQLMNDYPKQGRFEEWRTKQLLIEDPQIHDSVLQDLTQELSTSLDKGALKYLLDRNLLFNNQHIKNIKDRLSSFFRVALIFKESRFSWSLASPEKIYRLETVSKHFSTDRVFWRICYFLVFGWHTLSNSGIKLLRALLYYPIGIRYILTLSSKPFEGEQWISSNGEIHGKNEYPTHITHLYQHLDLIKRLRKEYESKSEYGLFPRSIGRLFNKIYCYIMVGLIGITLNMLFHYSVFIIFTLLVILALIFAPLWVPLVTVLAYLYSIFIYDSVGPQIYYDGQKMLHYSSMAPLFTTVLYHFLIRGAGVIIISLLAILFHALAYPVRYLIATLLYAIRSGWDTLMRVIFIRPFARIPGDNFAGLVTRIAGYGIAQEIMIELSKAESEQSYKDWLELYVLDEYATLFRENLYHPEQQLNDIMNSIYRDIIDEHYYPIRDHLDKHLNEYHEIFRKEFNSYHSKLKKRVYSQQMRLIRLAESDLADFLKDTQLLSKQTIESSLLAYMSKAQLATFWLNHSINKDDWAALNLALLERAFSPDIFTPVEQCDDSVSIRENETNMVQSLLKHKEPSSKVVFEVNGNEASEKMKMQLISSNNSFWSEIYHPLYLPLEMEKDLKYLNHLRSRALMNL